MPRSILDEAHIHPAIRDAVANNHADIVAEVKAAIAANDVVVVGMAQNFVKGVLVGGAADLKKLLDSGELKKTP